MGLFGFLTGEVVYRIRIFDGIVHLMNVEVRNKGQRFVTVTVHQELYGLGEKTKLAFMINPAIKPKLFQGHIMECDFDIRDAVPLSDLLDICPDLVYEINEKYRDYKKLNDNIVDAEVTPVEEQDSRIEVLTDPEPEKKPESVQEEEKEERPIDKVIETSKTAADIAAIAASQAPRLLNRFNKEETESTIEAILTLCTKTTAHRKLLYWVPALLHVEPEIHALVSQSMIYRTGIQPSYYQAQTGAMIAEKVLSRPKEPEGWQRVVLILGVLGLIVIGLIIIVWLIRGGHI